MSVLLILREIHLIALGRQKIIKGQPSIKQIPKRILPTPITGGNMATETGRISSQAQGVNPPLLIRSNLEQVAAIACAVAAVALAIFAFIGSEYLIAALSAAAGLSILYAFMQGENTAAVPTPTAPVVPVVTQPTATNALISSSATLQTTLTTQPTAIGGITSAPQTLPSGELTRSTSSSTTSVTEDNLFSSRGSVEEQEEISKSATTATSSAQPALPTSEETSSMQRITVQASSSLLPPISLANPSAVNPDEGSFLRRRSPDQQTRVVTKTAKFDPLTPKLRQPANLMSTDSSDTLSVGSSDSFSSTESKHRRTQSDVQPPSNAFDQTRILSDALMPRPVFRARSAVIADTEQNPLGHLLARPNETETVSLERSPFALTDRANEELDGILGGLGKHLDKSDPKPARRRAASHGVLTSPTIGGLQNQGSHSQMDPIEDERSATMASEENIFMTPPPARKQLPAPASGAIPPVTGTPLPVQGERVSLFQFLRSTEKRTVGQLPRSPSNPDFKTMAIFHATHGNMPIGAYTAGMFNTRSVKKLAGKDFQDKY